MTLLSHPSSTASSISTQVGDKTLTFETGKIARQAHGAVTIKSGETLLLATACMGAALQDVNFLPLRVDYQEKFSSAGKTLGGFIKREGRPTEKEILISRLIDRPIRPMFEEGYYHDTQITTTVFSYDGIHTTDPLAICAASAALAISPIPLIKPVGAVQIGRINDEYIINPSPEQLKISSLDLMLAGTDEAILMIEGYADFLTEEEILNAVAYGHVEIKKICKTLDEWSKKVGKPKYREEFRFLPKNLKHEINELVKDKIEAAVATASKKERESALNAIRLQIKGAFCNDTAPKYPLLDVEMATKEVISSCMRKMITKTKKRPDGRTPTEIRPIFVEQDLLPRSHGSVLFTRGETQSISVCTLGGDSMGQRYETLDVADGLRPFYLQYSFPPYSVGEVGRIGPPGRREIGHGKLAEKALQATVPLKNAFPYTIRLESNITESNGSSSMASVCGGSLAMLRAGVPIKRPISGIAMGLILENNEHVILSDILGIEDALGDMDFKIAGDEKGITAFQLDIKVEGITQEIMKQALEQAKEGRIHILQKMLANFDQNSPTLSKYAPRIQTIQIKPSQIGTVIGPGGKQIRAITEETGVEMNIDDSGVISITSQSEEGMQRALEIIHNLTATPEIGKEYTGTVVSIKDFGAFVAFLNVQGLCHISEIAHERTENIHDHFKEGDEIQVQVLDIDRSGKIRLSRKSLLPKPKKN